MKPLPGSDRATLADQHRDGSAATTATRCMLLTWQVAGSGHSGHDAYNRVTAPIGAGLAPTKPGGEPC
jgi:hypothetical protein